MPQNVVAVDEMEQRKFMKHCTHRVRGKGASLSLHLLHCTGGHRLAANFRPPINCKDAVQTFSGISSFRCSGDHDYLVMAVCPPAICLTFHFTRPKKEWEDFMLGQSHQMFAHPGECMPCHAFPNRRFLIKVLSRSLLWSIFKISRPQIFPESGGQVSRG